MLDNRKLNCHFKDVLYANRKCKNLLVVKFLVGCQL